MNHAGAIRLLLDLSAVLQERGQGLPVRDPPLPGGVAGVLRALFGLPPWVQISGIVIAVLGGLALAVLTWYRRAALVSWVRQRSRWFQFGMIAAALVFLLVAAAFGSASWHYTQHNNDFCTVCHVMSRPFKKFQLTRHAQIQCHDCHQQSIMASMHELRIWVLDRPEEIKGTRHTPNERCVACHVNGDPDKWKQIAATAGHRVHLESQRAEMKNLQCVQCHGVTVHEFRPVRETCGQAGCHQPEQTRIALGNMSALDTDAHCTMCHDFLRSAPARLATDSARQRLTPGQNQCLACHSMESLAGAQFAGTEVHGAICGSCHNPHTQQKAAAAVQSCGNAGCHQRADTITPFHRGLGRGTLQNCTQCHQTHTWKVRGDDCTACHRPDQLDRPRARSVSPHGTTQPAAPANIKVLNSGPTRFSVFPLLTLLRALLQEKAGDRPFRHARHAALSCTACHVTRDAHGALKVRSSADCAACHHSDRGARIEDRGLRNASCGNCHASAQLSGVLSLTQRISMSVWSAPRERPLPFAHERHAALACVSCHSDPPAYAAVVSCTSCHTQHHDVALNCGSCHQQVAAAPVHDRRVHATCEGSGCHSAATLPKPQTARSVCLACHPAQSNHQPNADCASCHLIGTGGTPAAVRRRP